VRRSIVIALAATAALLGAAAPASASAGSTQDGGVLVNRPWEPLPAPPFDLAAGAYCDFPVHGEATVNKVRTKVIEEYPDGSPKVQIGGGALKFRLTNTATGASMIADAGGSAVFHFFPDGTKTWDVVGPVLGTFRDGVGNVGRGVWTVNGIYHIHFTATNYKTITIYHGGIHDDCADIG